MKKAYKVSLPETQKPIRNMPLLSDPKDSSTDNAGRNAFNLQEMVADIDGHLSDKDQEKLVEEWPEGLGPKDKDPLELFVWLADCLDQSGEIALADFADFMIVKCAQAQSLDYSVAFRDLLLRINETESPESNQMITQLVKTFSRIIKSQDLKNIKIEDAKKEAYQQTLSLAQTYLEQK